MPFPCTVTGGMNSVIVQGLEEEAFMFLWLDGCRIAVASASFDLLKVLGISQQVESISDLDASDVAF